MSMVATVSAKSCENGTETGQMLTKPSPFLLKDTTHHFPASPAVRRSHVTELQPMACGQKYDMLLPGPAREIVPLCVLHTLSPPQRLGAEIPVKDSKILRDNRVIEWKERGSLIITCDMSKK